MNQSFIFVSGDCDSLETKKGSWAYVVVDSISEDATILAEGKDFVESTTNNRMEIMAFIRAVSENVGRYDFIHVRSASEYLVKTYNEWMHSWKEADFLSKSNQDLLLDLIIIHEKFGNKIDLKFAKDGRDRAWWRCAKKLALHGLPEKPSWMFVTKKKKEVILRKKGKALKKKKVVKRSPTNPSSNHRDYSAFSSQGNKL